MGEEIDEHARLAAVTAETFEPYVGSSYRAIDAAGNSLDLTLKRLDRLRSRPGQTREAFSLLFRGPRDLQMSQGSYRFEHPEMDALLFFVVPVGPDEEGMCYEAIFN